MAFKTFELPDIGKVTVYKRRRSRHIRLTVDHSGRIKVSQPVWAPYDAGLQFALSKRLWLEQQLQPHDLKLLRSGIQVGKRHRLVFRTQPSARLSSRLHSDNQIVITLPPSKNWDDDDAQRIAQKAAVRALRREAEVLLPARLQQLAEEHGFRYHSVTIRQLKSRWGSCDQDTNITLNLYLMQLPWDLIDYVLLHELTHTKVLQHGPIFWQAMQRVEPATEERRKQIKQYRTVLHHQSALA